MDSPNPVAESRVRVEGMDCASCATKIENALAPLPGVTTASVNYTAQSLRLQTSDPAVLEIALATIRKLGYEPTLLPRERAAPRADEDEDQVAWWKSRKARLTAGMGVLLLAAFLVSLIAPAFSRVAYSVAAAISLLPFAYRAYTAARAGTPFSIETLMTVAAAGAIAIGAAEEAAVVIVLFAVGELLENVAAGRARAGIKALINLVPRTALLEVDGQTRETPADRLQIGDVVVVRPGDRVPSDGEIIEGSSEVDEAAVTGESVPVPKTVGGHVFAGSINANGSLRVRITHTAADNTIARIIHLVEEAQGSKAPTARFIDRFSSVYTPAAMAFAALVVVVPPLLLGGDWFTWLYRGLAILLIACPCALVISTPAAIASGLAAGARRGLLIKGGAALEILGKVTMVAFDKTGTLTVGKPQVTDVIAIEGTDDAVLAKAAAVERGSSHPLGLAIIAAAEARGLNIPSTFGGSAAIPGKAVSGRLKEGMVSVGSPNYAAGLGQVPEDVMGSIRKLESEGKTVVAVLLDKRLQGLIALRDEPRDDAARGISRLKSLGVRALMLSGDNRRTADAVGRTLGVEVKAELLPDAKLRVIEQLKSQAPVAMVGDGINDAPALAAASVGIAMGGGTDVALETADAALLKNRVTGIADLIELSRATLANIWQNITLSLGLKAVFLATTVFGVTTLWMAILADTGATVLVTANALRLLRVPIGSAEARRRSSSPLLK